MIILVSKLEVHNLIFVTNNLDEWPAALSSHDSHSHRLIDKPV